MARNVVTEIGRFAFGGGRFSNQTLPFESASELMAFEGLVKEIAKALYRRQRPDARRLPHRFEERLGLSFRRLEGGSVVVPIEPTAVGIPGADWDAGQSYLEQAITLALDSANAANEDRKLPVGFPREALALVENFGRTLHADEYFEISDTRGGQCHYTLQTRQALLARATAHWEDAADISGFVTEVSIRRRQFTLETLSGTAVVVSFDPEQEAAVIEALAHHADHEVRVVGRGEYALSGLRRVPVVTLIQFPGTTPAAGQPFWQTILERAAAVPVEERGIIPKDGAKNLDAYLYGRPRRPKRA